MDDAGNVVGTFTHSGQTSAFLWVPGSTGGISGSGYFDLGATYALGTSSTAKACNLNPGGTNPLYVVGTSTNYPAFLYNNQTHTVSTLANITTPYGVNDYGWVVGFDSANSHAYVDYTDGSGSHSVDLTALVSGVPNGSQWNAASTTWNAYGISDYIPSIGGEVVTGYGIYTAYSADEQVGVCHGLEHSQPGAGTGHTGFVGCGTGRAVGLCLAETQVTGGQKGDGGKESPDAWFVMDGRVLWNRGCGRTG